MELQNGYRLVYLDGIPYVLPFGQASANLQRGARLNESGLFLWNALHNKISPEDLLAQMIAEYQPQEEDIPLLKQDLQSFLNQLAACHILDPIQNLPRCCRRPSVRTLSVGGITIDCEGPTELFAPEFAPFYIEGQSSSDIKITIVEGAPSHPMVGQILIRRPELTIAESRQAYFCYYPNQSGLIEWHLSMDGQNAVLYCKKPFPDEMIQEIFHAIRMIYLVLAQKRGLFALHSASILYQGKAWLFSGHSGAGKSTHAALWKEQFGVSLLNGDLNLLEIGKEGTTVHGIPWCGTSGISTVGSWPLGGIVFVRQHWEDKVFKLTSSERELSILHHLISPTWTEEMFEENLQFAGKLASHTMLFKLFCTKEPSAALVMKAAIDQ